MAESTPFAATDFKQLIGGRWVDAASGRVWNLVDPATEEIVQEVPFGSADDARAAVDAAATALPAWSARTAYERADVLEEAAAWITPRIADLARITTEESGKPLRESEAEWRSARTYLRWFAGEAVRAYGRLVPARSPGRRIAVTHRPVGVVATITAWNFPIYNNVRTWAAALAAGCTVVGRPAEYTPRSGMLLARAIQTALDEAGMPKGVMNLVNGEPEAMGEVFLTDPRVRKIAFTGSPRVGRILMDGASATMTQLALELGGNAPAIVLPDVADLGEIARKAVAWKQRNAGQVCVAPQRFLVHEDIADAFEAEVVAATERLVVGPGLEARSDVGPLINARQRDRVEALVRDSVEAGATVLAGGSRPDRAGYFYEPTVVRDAKSGVPVYDEEIFGPVLPITRVRDVDEAIALANATEYGLAAFLFTESLRHATRVPEALEFGMVCVNDWLPATAEAPFGGVKGSGMGRETGAEGLLEYLDVTTVFTGGLHAD